MKKGGRLPCVMSGYGKGALLVTLALVVPLLSGCLGATDESDTNSAVTMNVHFDATSGTVLERVQNGQTLTMEGVELTFDFARVTSTAGGITLISLDPGDDDDGANTVTVNANEQAQIAYEYQTHGLFTVTLMATDEQNNTGTMTLVVRIDKTVEWVQTNTNEASTMDIDTNPDCDCGTPQHVEVNSTVTNRNNIVPPGAPITVTWTLSDAADGVRSSHSEQIGEGQSAEWNHREGNVNLGSWSLEVTQGQNEAENLDINHTVHITYEAMESEPNPLDQDGAASA